MVLNKVDAFNFAFPNILLDKRSVNAMTSGNKSGQSNNSSALPQSLTSKMLNLKQQVSHRGEKQQPVKSSLLMQEKERLDKDKSKRTDITEIVPSFN